MASTHPNAQKRRSARAGSSETPKQALTALARRAARVRIAACTPAAKTLTGWAQAADRFAQTAVVTDRKAGQATGQGVNQFGGLWWAISPAGKEIHGRG